MKWFGQVVEPVPGFWQYLFDTAGPYAVVIILLLVALVYYVKKSDRLEKALNDEKDKRLSDAQEYSRLTLQPFQQFTDFVRNLYDGRDSRSKGN